MAAVVKKADRAWLAGFYEGEGSITCARNGKNRLLQIQIAQADYDCPEPLIRAHRLTGVGSIHGPYTHRSRNLASEPKAPKPRWAWHVNGIEDVGFVVALMKPWLSPRRLAQITVALDGWADYQRELERRGTRRPPPALVLAPEQQEIAS